MPNRHRYPPEIRERAVRLVFENEHEYPSRWKAICSIAEKSDLNRETLRQWVRQAERDQGSRPGLSTEEHDRLRGTSRRRTRSYGAPTRSSRPLRLSSGRSSTADRENDRVHRRAQDCLGSRADLQGAADRPQHLFRGQETTPSALDPAGRELKSEIRRVYDDNFKVVYGADKIWTQLNRENIKVARCTVEWLMRQLGVQGARRGGRHRTTIASDTDARPADLVERTCSASAPNKLWLADLERHEAPLDRMEMGGLHPWAVAAAREKLGAA